MLRNKTIQFTARKSGFTGENRNGNKEMTLQEIGLKHQTDKASHHHYLGLYELMFRPLRYRDIKLLEIGIQFGNSLRTWHEYFPFAKIWGVDSIDNHIQLPEDIVVLYAGAYNDDTVKKLGAKTYDIIIDDGSHEPLDQIWFTINYAPLLAPEGVLIVEDVLEKLTIPALASAIPQGFDYTAVEMCEGASMVDSRLFMCWRKAAPSKTWTV